MAESYKKLAREKQGALCVAIDLPTEYSPPPPQAGFFIAY